MITERQMSAAQRQYDARLPEEHDCSEGHDWQFVRSETVNGVDVSEYRCRVCGRSEVDP